VMPGMNQPDGMMTWWMGGWGGLVSILLITALIALIVWALTRDGRRSAPTTDGAADDALAVLEKRFARGEIDQDEFTRRRAALRDESV